MHRIRLHAQWKRDTSNPEVSRFLRAFHAPTGLQTTDRVCFTATLATLPPWNPHSLKVRLNETELSPHITDTLLIVELTPHLRPFNQLQLEWNDSVEEATRSPEIFPLENLALEIHSQLESE